MTGYPSRVIGTATGSSEDTACLAAKRDATQKAPRGTYARHGRGVAAAEITYDANGQVISRLEAAETLLARETRW